MNVLMILDSVHLKFHLVFHLVFHLESHHFHNHYYHVVWMLMGMQSLNLVVRTVLGVLLVRNANECLKIT